MEDNKNNISHDQQQRPPDPLYLSLSLTQPPSCLLSLPFPSLQTEQEVDRQVPHQFLVQMVNVSHFKHHPFPIYHVKSIMKFDPDVTMVSVEAPILLSKACEMFLADLTHCAWLSAHEKTHTMIKKPDVINALTTHEPCDFLLDLFPKEEPVQPEPVAPSDSVDLTDAIGFTSKIQPPPDYVMGVLVYYPPPPGLVIGTPVVYPAWPRILIPPMVGGDGADEVGPNGTANNGGN